MFDRLREDVRTVFERDPAAHSKAEVLLCYPGLRALWWHRMAHKAYLRGHTLRARLMSKHARRVTGIEIHPGARIGKGFFIDHGSGVVIGETAEIGDNVTLYQGVTLGGTGKDTGKRHPTIGNNVLVGSGAKVLGPFKVGDNSRIASNAVVLSEIPPDSTAVGVPARVVRIAGEKVDFATEVDQIHVTDPVALELAALRGQMEALEKYIMGNNKTKEDKENAD